MTTSSTSTWAGAQAVTVNLKATDALSGIGRTAYHIDGGAWQIAGVEPVTVTGYGDHTIDYASTDLAGNAEVMRHATVTLADVETISAILVPQVSGTPVIGSTLTATDGTWSMKDLTFTRQWLRNGSPIAGATGSTYTIGVADVGSQLSVAVTASKAGKAPGTATSAATAPVAKAASSVKASVNKTKVKSGKKIKVTAVVTAIGASPSGGKVQFVVDGKTVSTVTLTTTGKATVKVRIKGRGKHRVLVRYLGSPTVAASEAATLIVKGK